MTWEQTGGGLVQAVVPYDGKLLLVSGGDGWDLPSGPAEPAETPEAAAARIVYELTGYLVDGSQPLAPQDGAQAGGAVPAVVCQLLTADPSDGASLPAGRVRWTTFGDAEQAPLPPLVRAYLRGHSPV